MLNKHLLRNEIYIFCGLSKYLMKRYTAKSRQAKEPAEGKCCTK